MLENPNVASDLNVAKIAIVCLIFSVESALDETICNFSVECVAMVAIAAEAKNRCNILSGEEENYHFVSILRLQKIIFLVAENNLFILQIRWMDCSGCE